MAASAYDLPVSIDLSKPTSLPTPNITPDELVNPPTSFPLGSSTSPAYAPMSAAAPFATGPSSSAPADPSVLKTEPSPPLPPPVAGAPPPMISFDPTASGGSDDDGSDDDSGRPRKRKSTANLRGAAAAAVAAAGTSGSKAGAADEDDKGRRKIQIEYIEEKSKRHITFSKRKAGIMKKAYELSTLTGTQVLLLVVSESGWVYTFTTDKFKPLVKEDENGQLSQGQKLIAACLEAKEGSPPQQYPATIPANAASFEANSAIHGGQIALKTNNTRAVSGQRAISGSRRVSAKGRVPPAIRTDHAPMPGPHSAIPPVPQLPTPMSAGYLQDPHSGMTSPLGVPGARQPRSMSHPPPGMGAPSPGNMGLHPLQHQQMRTMQQQQDEYNDMISMYGHHPGDPNGPPNGGYDIHPAGHPYLLDPHTGHPYQQHGMDPYAQQRHHDMTYGQLTPNSSDGSMPGSASYQNQRSFSQQQQLGLGRPMGDYHNIGLGQPGQEEYVGQR